MQNAPTKTPHPPLFPRSPAMLVALALVAAFVLFTRLWALDNKAIQHDESMFAYYGFQITQTGRAGYTFMPILHGPLLQWASAAVFAIHDSDYTMRLFPALCGVGIVLLAFLMRGGFGRRETLWILAFLALSPTLTFFSRWCRNDVPFLFAAMLMLYLGWLYARRRWGWLLILWLLAAAFAVSIKETYVVFFFTLATFCLGCRIHGFAKKKPTEEIPCHRDVKRAFVLHWPYLIAGIAAGSLLIVSLFTSFFYSTDNPATDGMQHWDGPLEAFAYWAGEHTKHRIRGEFHFHLLHLAIYELPFVVFWTVCIVKQMWPERKPDPTRPFVLRRVLFLGWLISSLLILFFTWNQTLPPVFDKLLHMGRGLHLWLFLNLLLVVFITGWNHLNHDRVWHAFADYWVVASFLAYSYAGEKVPWVSAHIVLPLMIACGLYAEMSWRRWGPRALAARKLVVQWPRSSAAQASKRKAKRRRPERGAPPYEIVERVNKGPRFQFFRYALLAFVVAGGLWTLRTNLMLCFRNPGTPIERHNYASSHPEFHREMNRIKAEARARWDGRETPIFYQGAVEWPLLWTFRNYPNATRFGVPKPGTAFVIIESSAWDKAEPYRDFYDWKMNVPFRHYWVPRPLDWNAMKRFWLFLRAKENLSEEQRRLRETGALEWRRFWNAIVLRRDDLPPGHLARWEHLGGINVHVGRLKPYSQFTEPIEPTT